MNFPASQRLSEIASLYILNGEVYKCREMQPKYVGVQNIESYIKNKNRVIIENKNSIICYFKDEYLYDLKEVIDKLPNSIKERIILI